MMTIILPNNLLAMQLPQARIVIAARRDEVRRVGRERAVPHPALVARQRALEIVDEHDLPGQRALDPIADARRLRER